MRDVGIEVYPCDSAGESGEKSKFLSCCHRLYLQNFVVVFPVLEPETAFFPGFGIAGKCAYERREAVKFVVEIVG